MTEIEWKSPPATYGRGGSAEWQAIAAALRQRPNEWALVLPDASPTSVHGTSIKTGRIAAFRPAGSFEARLHTKPDGRREIYARYVGEATS